MMKHILAELIDTVEPTVEYGFMLYGELLHLVARQLGASEMHLGEGYEGSNEYYQLQTSPQLSGEVTLGEWTTTNLMTAMMMAMEPDKYDKYQSTKATPIPHREGALVLATTWRTLTVMCRRYTIVPLPRRLPPEVILEKHTLHMGEQERTLYTTYMGGDLKVQEVYYIPAYSQLVLCIARISGEYLLLVQTEGDVVDMYGHAGNQ